VATRRTTTDARVAWMDGLCALFSLHDSHWCVTHHDTACTFVAAGVPREDMFCLCTVRETYPLEAGWLPQRCKLSQVFFVGCGISLFGGISQQPRSSCELSAPPS
jgi:hypothetical protein